MVSIFDYGLFLLFFHVTGPVKKKKKFKPWKKLRRIFKKERKFVVDDSQNGKDESHEESVPSKLLEQDEEANKLPVYAKLEF